MKKLIVALQVLAALLVLTGGTLLVRQYKLKHRPVSLVAYSSLTPEKLPLLADVACGRPTTRDDKKSIACSVCPKGSDFADGTGWTLDSVLQGHFTAAKADEALVHISGCESHAKNFGGDFLMSRTAGIWTVVRYASGATVDEKCQKMEWQQGRDAVICQTAWTGQGITSDALQLLLFDAASAPRNDFAHATFLSIDDESANCGFQQPHNGPAGLMQFGDIKSAKVVSDKEGNRSLAVDATIERARITSTRPGLCPAGHRRTYHIVYHYLGDHFEAGDGYQELATQKRDDCCEFTINKSVYPGKY